MIATLPAAPPRKSSRPTTPLLALVVAAALLLGAGCSAVRATLDLCSQINRGGGQCDGVSFNTVNGYDSVVVNTSAGADRESTNVQRISEITWTSFPYRFDGIVVSRRGNGIATELSRSELQSTFGPRPPGLDDKSLTAALAKGAIRGVAIAGVVGLLCLGAVILLIIVLVRRSRSKRSQGPPPGTWGGPQPSYQGQQPGAWGGPPAPQMPPQPQPPPQGSWGAAPAPAPQGPWGAAPPASAPGPWDAQPPPGAAPPPAAAAPWQPAPAPGTPTSAPPSDPWGAPPR